VSKLTDKLLGVFIVVYEIFLYSLIPLMLCGVITLFVTPLIQWYMDKGGVVIYGSALIFGVCFKLWRDKHSKTP
jgi:hypothetical protein